MKISLLAILPLVLLSYGNPTTSKKESKDQAASCKCGPNLSIDANVPASFGGVSLFKITVQNTSTGATTVYPQPTGIILFPQDGGFRYVVTYIFEQTVTGVVSYINDAHNECGNVDFQGTHGAINFNTLCENYTVSLRSAGSHVLCN